jgi:hypothetical protein
MQLQYGNTFRKHELWSETRTEQRLVPITAELTGSHQCGALGIIATGHVPALNLCRSLLAAGVDPDKALNVYRNGILSLSIRSIREGAKLTVENGEIGVPRFRLTRLESRGAAPPMRKIARGRSPLRAGAMS